MTWCLLPLLHNVSAFTSSSIAFVLRVAVSVPDRIAYCSSVCGIRIIPRSLEEAGAFGSSDSSGLRGLLGLYKEPK